MAHKSKFNLGDRVREPISGIEGIVETISFWRFDCVRIGIRRFGTSKDDAPHEIVWFDEPVIELIEARPDLKGKPKMGPRQDPVSRM